MIESKQCRDYSGETNAETLNSLLINLSIIYQTIKVRVLWESKYLHGYHKRHLYRSYTKRKQLEYLLRERKIDSSNYKTYDEMLSSSLQTMTSEEKSLFSFIHSKAFWLYKDG